MMTLFAALSAGAKTYLLWSFSIFLFHDFTERLVGCLYKCGCLVKFSIRMSIIRRNSFFQSLRACTPTSSTWREKGRDLTQSYDKSPLHQQNFQKGKMTTQTTLQKSSITAVADRLRTVSWSNYGHPTGVVNLVYGPNLPTPRKTAE